MTEFERDLIEALEAAVAHARGDPQCGVRVTTVHVPDVRSIRDSLQMSQAEFAYTFRIPLATLKGWEQGRR